MADILHPGSDATDLAAEFEHASAEEVLRWAVERFGRDLTLACSLGAEDMVLVDLLVKIDPGARIFVLDTARLHEATYAVIDAAREKYGIEFEVYFPDETAVQNLMRTKGAFSFRQSVENRKECCAIRKVEPLGRALAERKAWITGLRRAQSVTRLSLPKIEWDEDHGLYKLNPLAEWSEEAVWDHVREHDVPINELHAQGFPSIGCEPCTRAIFPGEDVRAGRWWWETPEQKECGLHVRGRKEGGYSSGNIIPERQGVLEN